MRKEPKISKGFVEIALGITAQPAQYTAVRLDPRLNLQIEPGEKPQDALRRCLKEVQTFMEKNVEKVCEQLAVQIVKVQNSDRS